MKEKNDRLLEMSMNAKSYQITKNWLVARHGDCINDRGFLYEFTANITTSREIFQQ